MSSEDDYIMGDTNSIMCHINAGVCRHSANVIFVSGDLRSREGYVESVGEPPLQQVRTVIHPFNNQLANHTISTHPLFKEILLITPESEDVIQHRLYFIYIDLIIVIVITSYPQSSSNIYSPQDNNTNGMKFTHIFLCKVQYKIN